MVGALLTTSGVIGVVRRAVPYFFFLNGVPDAVTPMPPYSNVWWSLATEMQFYLVLPLLPLALRTRLGRVVGIAVLLAWATAYAAFLTGALHARTIGGHITLGVSLFGRLPLFLAGIAAAWIYLHRGASVRAYLRRMWVLRQGGADLMLGAVLLLLAYLLRWVVWLGPHDEINPPYHAWHVPEAVLWALLVLLLLLAPLRVKPLFSNPLLNRLGVLSYSIYVLHLPIIHYSLVVAWRWLPPQIGWHVETLLIALGIAALCVGAPRSRTEPSSGPSYGRKSDCALEER